MIEWSDVIRLTVVGLLAVVFAYAMVRGVSLAYFRSKLEAWRRMKKEMREGEGRDGV